MPKKLQPVLDTLEGLDAQFHEYYDKRADGKFVLNLDGVPPGFVTSKQLDEFRTNNIALKKQLEELEKSGRVLTPEEKAEYVAIKKAIEDADDKDLIDAGKVDELVNQKTERMRAAHEAQVKNLTDTNDKLTKQLGDANTHLSSVLIDSEVTRAVSTVGQVRKGAMADVLNRAKAVWKVMEGKPVAMNGDVPMYSADGKTPLSITEWAQSLTESAGYLFEGSPGGGGGGDQKAQKTTQGGKSVISKDDPSAFSANLEQIAKGEVLVK